MEELVLLSLELDSVVQLYAEAAVARLRYLHPRSTFAVVGPNIEVGGTDALADGALLRDVRYALYREKVQAESEPLRKRMFEALFR